MTTPQKTKFPWLHLAIALVVTAAYLALTYKHALIAAVKLFGSADAPMVRPYMQGQFIGAFIFPAIACGIAGAIKGRNPGRILKTYWITCFVVFLTELTSYPP
jgi:hypothetical protein